MRKFTTILMAILVLVTCQIVIQAQITTGSISGTVTDQTGAVVPGANVTVKGEAGQQYTAVTKGDGVYHDPRCSRRYPDIHCDDHCAEF